MNSIGFPFLPPSQPLRSVQRDTSGAGSTHSSHPLHPPLHKLPSDLFKKMATFLEPVDWLLLAQSSKKNYEGVKIIVRLLLKANLRNDSWPLTKFSQPQSRLDTAVPIDPKGRRYLESLEITGKFSLDLIKTGQCSIAQMEHRLKEISTSLLPYIEEDCILEDDIIWDYIAANLTSCEEVLKLKDEFAEDILPILDDALVRQCIQKGYLTFARALEFNQLDLDIVRSAAVRPFVENSLPLNLEKVRKNQRGAYFIRLGYTEYCPEIRYSPFAMDTGQPGDLAP